MADVSRDFTIVDSLLNSTLDMNSVDLVSINTMIASRAMNALLRNEVTPGRTSTPKRRKPEVSPPLKKKVKVEWCCSEGQMNGNER